MAQGTIEAGAETVVTSGGERERLGQGGDAIPVKDSRLWDPSLAIAFSVLGDWGTLISEVGGVVATPWPDKESLCRMVWLIKKRQRPTGDEWGTDSIVELVGVLTCS